MDLERASEGPKQRKTDLRALQSRSPQRRRPHYLLAESQA